MEVAERKCSSGYGKPPWIFKGSALYQLHLVRAETAKALIPKEFKLVEAFGYTLGGFFLANYEESPAGAFDEVDLCTIEILLVVIAGIVWNPPTSCAWAARVLVSSNDACDHGRKEVGLPSQVAKFSKRMDAVPRQKTNRYNHFLDMIGLGAALFRNNKNSLDVQVTETNGSCATNLCNINLATTDPGPKFNKWIGPQIKMSLPSFSGRTKHNPNLLKYSCKIECRVQVARPARVTGPFASAGHETEESTSHHSHTVTDPATGEIPDNVQVASVMLSKPILALRFSCLKMEVDAPITVSDLRKSSTRTSLRFS